MLNNQASPGNWLLCRCRSLFFTRANDLCTIWANRQYAGLSGNARGACGVHYLVPSDVPRAAGRQQVDGWAPEQLATCRPTCCLARSLTRPRPDETANVEPQHADVANPMRHETEMSRAGEHAE